MGILVQSVLGHFFEKFSELTKGVYRRKSLCAQEGPV